MGTKTFYNKIKGNIEIIAFLIGILAGIYLLSSTLGKAIYGGAQPTFFSFIFTHFAGYLFFILSPVELLFLYFVRLNYNVFLLIFAAIVTAVLAQLIDYTIGYFVSNRVILAIVGQRRYEKLRGKIDKYGGMAIFIFNLFPLSSPVIVLVAGMVQYPLKKVLINSGLE